MVEKVREWLDFKEHQEILYDARKWHFSSEQIKEEAKRSFVEWWWSMCKHDMKYKPSDPKIVPKPSSHNLAGINDLLGISMPEFADDNFLFMIWLGYFGPNIQQALAMLLSKIHKDADKCSELNLLITENKQDEVLQFLLEKSDATEEKTFNRLYREFIDKQTDTKWNILAPRSQALCNFEITILHALKVFKNQKPGAYDMLIMILKREKILKYGADYNNFRKLSTEDVCINTAWDYQNLFRLLGKNIDTKEQAILKGFFSCLFNSIYVDFDPRYRESELILKKTAEMFQSILGVEDKIADKRQLISEKKTDGDYSNYLWWNTHFDLQTQAWPIPSTLHLLTKSVVSTAHKTARDPDYSHAEMIEDMLRWSLVLDIPSTDSNRSTQYRNTLFHLIGNIQTLQWNKTITAIKRKDKWLMKDCYTDDGKMLNKEKVRVKYQSYIWEQYNQDNQDNQDDFEKMYDLCFKYVETSKSGQTAESYKDSKFIIEYKLNDYINESGEVTLKDMKQTIEFKILLKDRKETNESWLAHHDRFRLKQEVALYSREEKYISEYDLLRYVARFKYHYTEAVQSIEQEMRKKSMEVNDQTLFQYLLTDLCKDLVKCQLLTQANNEKPVYFYLTKKIYQHQKGVWQVMLHTLAWDQWKITDGDIDTMIDQIPIYNHYREEKIKSWEWWQVPSDWLKYYTEWLLLATMGVASPNQSPTPNSQLTPWSW